MAKISSWNVKTSDNADWLHFKSCTREDALKQAQIAHPADPPSGFVVYRSNVDDTPTQWLEIYPDGNFPE